MKKIILILALLSLGVSKAQVVGGYLPLNSSKSFTAGNSTFSNVIARGTLSVGSTATVTGGLKVVGASTIGTGQNNYFGVIISSQLESTSNGYIGNKLRVGSNVTPTATLDVTGDMKVSSTFSLGSANLTGGNTGTVAVLSDAVFPVYLTGGAGTPADGTTYYIGGVFVGYWWTGNTNKITLPYNCTLVRWDYNWAGSPGTGEAATISINGTTNYTLSSAITFSNAAASETYSESGLSQNFNAGDSFNIKMVCPTWVTNPTGLYTGITLWFVRRS